MSDDQPYGETAHVKIPDFEVIMCTIEISRSAAMAWDRIGNYGLAGKYLSVESHLIAGEGDVGSVRTVGGSVVEVMVQKGTLSYTYAQTAGPMAPFAYHGSVAIEPSAPGISKLTYTISFNQAEMASDQRRASIERIRPRC